MIAPMLLTALLPTTYVLATYNAGPAPAAPPPPRTGTPDRPATMAYAPILYIDGETGCHYLSTDGLQTLVPRMDGSGKQVCPRVAGAQQAQANTK